MANIRVSIVTADDTLFEGEARQLVVRTTEGDVGLMHGHIPYVAALGIGPLTVILPDGARKEAAVAHGIVQADRESVTVLAHSCEWADEIDLARAERAKERAEASLNAAANRMEMDRAEVKLKRALVRLQIGGKQ